MTDPKLIEALTRNDADTREERAERIVWLSQHIPSIRGFIAPVEATVLMEEARSCFVYGKFAAALMLSASYIEHTLTDALLEKQIGRVGLNFVEAIKLARANDLFPSDLLDRTDNIRMVRNPFAHRKPDNHQYSLGTRFLSQKIHPQLVLESDAALAISTMYEYFRRTLRSA